jgi:dTMP kinase
VIEGADGVGRSTHIALLRAWLESRGHAVLDTGMTRSVLAARGIKEAKTGHTLGRLTMQLFYSTDFMDRLENEMLPALRAGFVVLTDRYIYSAIARAEVRGIDSAWIRAIYSMALVPDAVFYLRISSPQQLVERVLSSGRGFDYWESGMDYLRSDDIYENYIRYQGQLIEQFDAMSKEYHFHVVDANQGVPEVFAELRDAIRLIVEDMQLPADLGGARPAPARKRRNASARPTNASKA